MKKLIIFTIVTITFMSSCSEDFLVKDPLDRVTDVSLTFTALECKLYVNKFYTATPYIYTQDVGTDNLLSTVYNSNPDLIDGLRVVPSSGGGWGINEWSNIRSVNFLLDNYTKSQELDMAEKYVGEARFFRAKFYFEQFLKRFGGVPWIEKQLTLTSAELTSPRLKRNELADKILADLDWAIEKIPSFNVQEYGRISKEVAMLYKARVALYEATWEKYHAGTAFAGEGNPEDYFRVARDAAKAVMSSGLFSLDNVGVEDGYHILFNQRDYSNSKEVMLWQKFDRSLGMQNNNNVDAGRNGQAVGLSRRLVESYLCIDGKPIHNSELYQGDDNLLTVVSNRDPRLSQTMFVPGRARTILDNGDTTIIFVKPNISLTGKEKSATGYELAKGAEPHYSEQISITGSIKATIFYRYAEALLIYAEARAELGEITQADLDETINALRDRVGMPHLNVNVGFIDPYGDFTVARGYEGVSVSNLLQEIRRERRVELACEGYRMDDLKRWRAHHLWNHDKIQGAKTAQFENLTWLKDHFMVVGAPHAIHGGYDYFISETVAKWQPQILKGENYWTDDEGYFEPYQKFIPSGHFAFDANKSYLLPIPSEQLILNENLIQNPGWPDK